jgi:hypothetical protein
MSENLTQIERRLESLEAAVVQEYSSRKLDALRDGQDRIALNEQKIDQFARHLGELQTALYATGDPKKLQIVSELHDLLRIRMISIQHILEREIPKPYAEQALFEGDRDGGYAASGRLPAASTKAPARSSLLGRVFQRGEPAKPASPSRPATPPPSNHMRILHLHKLMEEDKQHLMAPAERPPHVQAAAPGSANPSPAEAAYRFKVKFVAETHHGQRVATEKIARTPEELRAKLAKRAEEPDNK